jgi:hypothetical protein
MGEHGLIALFVGVFAAFGVHPMWMVALGLLGLGCALSVFGTYIARVALVRRDGYQATPYNGVFRRLAFFVGASLVTFGLAGWWSFGFASWWNLPVAFAMGVGIMIMDTIDFVESQQPNPSNSIESAETS